MKELTLQEAAELWARRVQVQTTDKNGKWRNIEKPGEFVGGGLTAGVFTTNEPGRAFHLAPEPPAKRYRPWTPEEVPVGALIQHGGWIGSQVRYAICGVERDQIVWMTSSTPGKQTLKQLVSDADWRHSTDNGKTWLPCGVEVA